LKSLLIVICFICFSLDVYSQDVLGIRVQPTPKSLPLKGIIEALEKEHEVRFFFREEWLEDIMVHADPYPRTLRELLEEAFTGTDISFHLISDFGIVIIKDRSREIAREEYLYKAMLQKKVIEKITLGDPLSRVGRKQFVLTGVIRSDMNRDPVSQVSVEILNHGATTTDTEGRFKIEVPKGNHVVQLKRNNYHDKVVDLAMFADGNISLTIESAPRVLDEVEISDQSITTSRVSQTSIRIIDIKRAPTFLGEVDVIKSLQTQPGVTTVGEVASGFNVRGGSVDQNLVLFEGVPIFNTSHALGFFTAFNPDIIGNTTFYRGGIPAEFGGRVSSVLKITAREGDFRRWHGSGGIGIISSYATIGGPIKTDTSSLIVSGRTSYSNWMLDAVKSNYNSLENTSLRFFDGGLKYTHKVNAGTKFMLSGYVSHDDFTLTDDTLYQWKNYAFSMRLDKTLKPDLFATAALNVGHYGYSFSDSDPLQAFDLDYSITYPSLKVDFNRNGKHSLAFGLHSTYYIMQSGELKPRSQESNVSDIRIPQEHAMETALYISDEFALSNLLTVEAGFRYSLYNRLGKGIVYQYKAGAPIETYNVVDSTIYNSGDVMKTYHGLEPRLSLRYELSPTASFKMGYNRVYQYLHLVTNTAAVAPVDIWQVSNTYFKPQRADQVSLGYFRKLDKPGIEFFTEAFYKVVENVLEFKDGARLLLNRQLETALLNGTSHSYGIEMSLSKTTGRLIGTLNYTLSRSLRRVPGAFQDEAINDGKQYPSNFDQPHILNVNWRYGISRRHFFSGIFTYHTGRPMSVPIALYNVDGVPVADFSNRNEYRIPDYHRLDIAFIIEGNHRKKKLLDGTWTFSFYNVYARKNPYSAFFKDGGDGYLKPYTLSVIGTVIPSVSYSFKF